MEIRRAGFMWREDVGTVPAQFLAPQTSPELRRDGQNLTAAFLSAVGKRRWPPGPRRTGTGTARNNVNNTPALPGLLQLKQ